MFEIGRELKRFFQPAPPRDGLSLGDASLLELLDLDLLTAEAKAADVAAGRIGVQDKPRRLIEASVIWREFARRTGDAAALRKAAASAEQAGRLAREEGRSQVEAQALCAQARAGLVGADLFAEDGLHAAAEHLLQHAPETPEVQAVRAVTAARLALGGSDPAALHAAIEEISAVLADRRLRLAGVERAALRLEQAEFLTGAGVRLGDAALIGEALGVLAGLIATLDGAYNPILLARAQELRALALIQLAEMRADAAAALGALDALESALELTLPDHSPLDWARLQHGRGLVHAALAEASEDERSFLKALQAFGQALGVIGKQPHLALRAVVVQDRVACLVRRAEARGDVYALDEAEAVLRGELAALKSPPDPIAWAVFQLNLARIYEAQAKARGCDRGEHARAGEALLGALDVFSEHGLRSLADLAATDLERLREASAI
jgi:tetratricopeptide (TPR) repeat protein